jgi:hypothetical protein
MRFTCLRWLAYALALGVPALAQPPAPMSREMPRVELSVGLGSVRGGPAHQVEREMTRLGLDHRDGLLERPKTSFIDFPPAFAQVHVGVRRHTMVGVLVSTFGLSTVGQADDGGIAHVHSTIVSRALIVSYRPTPWIRIGAGPALHRSTVEFPLADRATREQRLGWIAGGDVKFMRRPLSYQHPPTFGYLTAQYRGAPSVRVPAGSLPLSGFDRRSVSWPGQRVRTSHWIIGVGVGFEI